MHSDPLSQKRERQRGGEMEGEREGGHEGGWKNWTGKGEKERKEKSLTESAVGTHEKSYLNT